VKSINGRDVAQDNIDSMVDNRARTVVNRPQKGMLEKDVPKYNGK